MTKTSSAERRQLEQVNVAGPTTQQRAVGHDEPGVGVAVERWQMASLLHRPHGLGVHPQLIPQHGGELVVAPVSVSQTKPSRADATARGRRDRQTQLAPGPAGTNVTSTTGCSSDATTDDAGTPCAALGGRGAATTHPNTSTESPADRCLCRSSGQPIRECLLHAVRDVRSLCAHLSPHVGTRLVR